MVAPAKRTRDEFQSFYTNCDYITSYMVGLLSLCKESKILEPCAGDGAFVDQIIENGHEGEIHLFDLDPESIKKLEGKYKSFKNIEIEIDDFVFRATSEKYDRIIANPPYGAYQTPEKRTALKKKYPSFYSKETYGIFLVRALEMLVDRGKLVFIIPDTYLTLHMHEGLRARLIDKYTINSITLFPSNFFPGVNFGYAGLSIIEVTNEKPARNHTFSVIEGMSHQKDLPSILEEADKYKSYELSYLDILKSPSLAFYSKKDKWITSAISSSALKICDIASVATGFYSGNDAKYLRRAKSVTRGAKKYKEILESEICPDILSAKKPLNGISGKNHWVPIVKGGNRRFHKPSEWYMNWSIEAIEDYRVTNKKRARFQNSQYYFCEGIGVPMVSSSSITGAMIDGRLFDQSIVGVFPKVEYRHLLLYLLGFFNSSVCNMLIRTINASTNNSSNYLKKLPLIVPDEHLLLVVNRLVKNLIERSKTDNIGSDELNELNSIFNKIYSVPEDNKNI